MKIEIATIDDFPKYATLKMLSDEGFRTFHTEHFEKGHTWISMEKNASC